MDEVVYIISNVMTFPRIDIKENTKLSSIGIDSISYVRIVIDIENQFSIQFPFEKLIITENTTVGDLCKIILELKK